MQRTRLIVAVLSLSLGACSVQRERTVSLELIRKPTPEHKLLLEGVGTWEGTITSWGMPGAPPEGLTLPARETVEPVGEYFTQTRFTCEFPGMPYLGMGCMGYDPIYERLVGTWFDNTTSYLAGMQGLMDVKNRRSVVYFELPDETTGVLTVHRIETEFGTDTFKSTFFKGDGEGTRTMVIAMKRVGKAPTAK